MGTINKRFDPFAGMNSPTGCFNAPYSVVTVII
jgi:hypothetical protein